MRFFIVVLMLNVCLTAHGQGINKYLLKEVGWTIELPRGFEKMSLAADAANNQKGKNAIESVINQPIDASGTRTLISATKNIHEYFNATITAFNVKKDGSYYKSNVAVKKLIYNTFKAQMPQAVIDSATTIKLIGGLKFDKFQMKAFIDQKLLFTMVLCSKLYKGYDFGISYLFIKSDTENELDAMFENSSFKVK